MTDKQIVAIDFGSENIRLARSTYNVYAPQILSPNLLNAVRVDRNRGVTAIGSSVYDGVQMGTLINGVNLFDAKLGSGALQALYALLQEIHRMFDFEALSEEQKSKYETLFSVPIGSPSSFLEIAKARLLEKGFPAPRAFSAVTAILFNYFPDKEFQPGDYLIVDCGASHTRMALCAVDSSKRLLKLEEDVSGATGGNEIDMLLLEHFSTILNNPQINRVELLNFVRQFKVGFLNQIRQGSTKYVTRSPFSTGVSAFDLSLEDFQNLSRTFFETFEKAIVAFLESHKTVPANLKGLLLAGGNAQWPFAHDLVERLMGKNKVFVSEYPEDAIVRGLSLTMVDYQPRQKESAAEPISTPVTSAISAHPNPEKKRSALPSRKEPASFPLWLAMLLEFFPGLFGILGAGWVIGTHTVFGLPWWPWIFLVLAWPVLLIVLIIILVGTSFKFSNWTALILLFPVWLGVPFASGLLAFWVARKKNRGKHD